MLDKTFALLTAIDGLKVEGDPKDVYALWVPAMREVKTLRTLPRIICLCGSTRFRDQILAASERYTMDGNIVLAPNVFGREFEDTGKHEDDVLVNSSEKGLLDALHFRKIDLADQIHVLNVGGYIGKSTHNAISYAVRKDKMVSFSDEKVIPWDTKHREPVSVTHYMSAVRARAALEAGGGEGS